MDIKICTTASEAAIYLAQILLERISKNKDLKLGVATGRTMDAVYYNLVNMLKDNQISCHRLKCFALDEYIGLSPEHINSYEYYLNLHFYRPLSIPSENTFILNAYVDDFEKACQEYEQQIKNAGGIDVQILGVGTNGHIGLNEPGSAADSRSRVVALTSSTLQSNKTLFKQEQVPQTALTMGIGTIMEAQECILLATGESKASIIQKIVNGDINGQVPASALKSHKNFTLILDSEAAKLI